ncbi:MAG: DUF2339 domain-containing protein, partial [Sebaldella sp.]|nr:DUF2339 domain-containing protein [Sebaldella sp.]
MKEEILEAIKQQDKVIEEIKNKITYLEEENTKIKEELLKENTKNYSEINIEKLKIESKENLNSTVKETSDTKSKSKEIVKKEESEIKLGLYIFNYIGVVFIFLGFISLAFLTGKYMNNSMKSFTLYLFSFIFLGAGYFYFKRNKVIFSRGLLGCGIGLLYISTYVAHFVLLVFNKETAITVSIFVTILSIILTMYYKSVSIAILSQIGGYLPVFAFLYSESFSNKALIISQVYVLLLNILMYIIYNKYQWKLLKIVSFSLMSLWILTFSFNKNELIYINYLYSLVYFVIYFLPIKFEKNKKEDEINQCIKIISIIVLSLTSLSFLKFEKNVSNIVILISQIALYNGLNIYFIKNKEENSIINILLEAFSNIWLVALGIIFLPFVYMEKYEYALIFTNILVIINVIFYIKRLINRYILISTVYICYFYVIYFVISLFSLVGIDNFEMKYKVIFLILNLITFFLMKKSKIDFKYFGKIFIILLYFHIEYFLLSFVSFSIDRLDINIIGSFEKVWLNIIIMSIFTYITLFIKEFKKYKLPFVSFSIILVITLIYNLLMPVPKTGNYEIRFILILVANLLSNALSIYGIVKFVSDKRTKEQIIIFMISGALLLNGTIIAYNNIDFSYLNILLDVIYGLLSLCLIIIGFKRDFGLVRKVGLFMLIVTTFKLMILDIPTTTLLS